MAERLITISDVIDNKSNFDHVDKKYMELIHTLEEDTLSKKHLLGSAVRHSAIGFQCRPHSR